MEKPFCHGPPWPEPDDFDPPGYWRVTVPCLFGPATTIWFDYENKEMAETYLQAEVENIPDGWPKRYAPSMVLDKEYKPSEDDDNEDDFEYGDYY